MSRVPYERSYLRRWIRNVAASPSGRRASAGTRLESTYEDTFRWQVGSSDRPSVFLFRRGGAPVGMGDACVGLTPFDAVLVDACHGYEWVRYELAELGACVRPGGVFLVPRARSGLDRALSALHAWADDAGRARAWPHQASQEVLKVFEDLRAATPGGAELSGDPQLRDLREDFADEAASEGWGSAVARAGGTAQGIGTRSMLASNTLPAAFR